MRKELTPELQKIIDTLNEEIQGFNQQPKGYKHYTLPQFLTYINNLYINSELTNDDAALRIKNIEIKGHSMPSGQMWYGEPIEFIDIEYKIPHTIFFEKCTFNNGFEIRNSYFNSIVFSECTFNNGRLGISLSKFKNFGILKSEINGITSINATFIDQVLFEGTQFNWYTSFSCQFEITPKFYNATLHKETSFQGSKFLRTQYFCDYCAYRELKRLTKEINAKLDEDMFFVLEQRTLRKIEFQENLKKNWFTVSTSWFYDVISEYGTNILKPVAIFLSSILIFAMFYWMIEDAWGTTIVVNSALNNSISILPKEIALSLQNIYKPFSLFDKELAYTSKDILIGTVSIIQTLFSISVIALWFVALRRRFQKSE